MASGFRSGGVDLDDIFATYISGIKPPFTGFEVNGQDLKDRYQPYVSGPKVAETGFKVNGIDLNSIFTNVSNLPVPTYSGGIYGGTSVTTGTPATASVTLNWFNDGSFTRSFGNIGNSGFWYSPITGGIGSSYEIRITPTLSYINGNTPSVTNPAASFVSLNVNRTLTFSVTQNIPGESESHWSVLVEIRISGGGPVVSSYNFTAQVIANRDA